MRERGAQVLCGRLQDNEEPTAMLRARRVLVSAVGAPRQVEARLCMSIIGHVREFTDVVFQTVVPCDAAVHVVIRRGRRAAGFEVAGLDFYGGRELVEAGYCGVAWLVRE